MANNAQSFKAPQCEKQARMTEMTAQKLVSTGSPTDPAPTRIRRGCRAADKSRPAAETFALTVMSLSLGQIRRRGEVDAKGERRTLVSR
jgi:hypothetical protein